MSAPSISLISGSLSSWFHRTSSSSSANCSNYDKLLSSYFFRNKKDFPVHSRLHWKVLNLSDIFKVSLSIKLQ